VVHGSKLSWASEHHGSIGTCHKVHHHGAPLKLMRTLREFQDGQEIWVTLQSNPRYFSYHQSVRDESVEKSLKALECDPCIASGRPPIRQRGEIVTVRDDAEEVVCRNTDRGNVSSAFLDSK
jgi:hypothetical protein